MFKAKAKSKKEQYLKMKSLHPSQGETNTRVASGCNIWFFGMRFTSNSRKLIQTSWLGIEISDKLAFKFTIANSENFNGKRALGTSASTTPVHSWLHKAMAKASKFKLSQPYFDRRQTYVVLNVIWGRCCHLPTSLSNFIGAKIDEVPKLELAH